MTLYKRLLGYLKPYWQRFAISLVALAIAAATEPAFARLMKPLVDGGFVGHQQVEQASAHTTVYGPVPAAKDKTVDPHQPKPDDSPAVAAWRARMGTDEAKAIYKNRAATAECVNAQSRNRGLQQFRVRGLAKVKCVVLFFALAHNLMRMASLAPEMLALGKGASAVSGIGA